MPQDELIGWIAYTSMEPIGALRDDLRAAHQNQLIHQISLGFGKGRRKAKKVTEYMLQFDNKPKRVQTPSEIMAVAEMWAASGIGTVSKGN